MKRLYGLLADIHCHNWSAFSNTSENGVNSRLQIILDEIERCAEETSKAGGDTLIIAGDMFHVRGSIAPSVLNPVREILRAAGRASNVKFLILPGNHDMEHKNSNQVGNAIEALECECVQVIHEPTLIGKTFLVPWFDRIDELKDTLNGYSEEPFDPSEFDLIIHAPIDGVIFGLPDHGITSEWLASLGFKRVFAGHYHDHKDFGNGVYSIGAIAHHTWSDVGSKAGFLLVGSAGVVRRASQAPSFVEITGDMDEYEVPMIVDGNYVRAKVETSSIAEIEQVRQFMLDNGAKGVVIQSMRKPTEERDSTATPSSGGISVEASIADFIKGEAIPNPSVVQSLCENILTRTVSGE